MSATRPYIAFYKGKKIEVQASTSFQAQCIAAEEFNARKSCEITVMLADIEHSTASL
jgi:hypothetical protein